MERYTHIKNKINELRSNTKQNRRMRRFVGEQMHAAGMEFLKSVHQELYDKKPQWEQDAIQADLKLLAEGNTDMPILRVSKVKPELSDDYLIAIGRADLVGWPSE